MKTLVSICLMLLSIPSWGQKYISENSDITFFSEAPLENIKATNIQASSLIDLSSGDIVFSVPIKSFKFRKSLMQQHFNENYMESEEYPKANFKGKLKNYQQAPGIYQASAVGEMTIHGQTRKVEIPGDLIIDDKSAEIKAVFLVSLQDYKIKIPKILFSNIAEEVEVTVFFKYRPYDNP